MRPARALLLILVLTLTGCGWTGPLLYAAADLRSPIPAGDYGSSAEHGQPARIAILPNGLTRIGPLPGGSGAPTDLGIAPLDREGRYFVMWIVSPDDSGEPQSDTFYALLESRPNGRFLVYSPNCDRDRADAIAAGVNPGPGRNSACQFHSRTALEAGLRSFARHPGEGVELAPIPNG